MNLLWWNAGKIGDCDMDSIRLMPKKMYVPFIDFFTTFPVAQAI
jgi:hypothetical protein